MQEYLVDLNATQAALRAGYKNADVGRQLLTKTHVSEAIQQAKQERAERTEVTQDYVINKLKEIADKKASDMTDSDLKYANKLRALELLGKHVGAFDGRGAADRKRENNLLEAIQGAEEIKTDDLPETQ